VPGRSARHDHAGEAGAGGKAVGGVGCGEGRAAERGRERVVRKLANEALIYAELLPVFSQSGLEIKLTSVEKVLVLPAGRLPFFEKLREGGVRAPDRVPFDCQTWFSVRPSGGVRREEKGPP